MKIMFGEDVGCGPYLDIERGACVCKAENHCIKCYDWLMAHPGEILNKRSPSSDPINPPHYKADGIEAIDVIERFGYGENYYRGSALKYVLRGGKKGPATEDLKKAIWFLQREIDAAEGGKR